VSWCDFYVRGETFWVEAWPTSKASAMAKFFRRKGWAFRYKAPGVMAGGPLQGLPIAIGKAQEIFKRVTRVESLPNGDRLYRDTRSGNVEIQAGLPLGEGAE